MKISSGLSTADWLGNMAFSKFSGAKRIFSQLRTSVFPVHNVLRTTILDLLQMNLKNCMYFLLFFYFSTFFLPLCPFATAMLVVVHCRIFTTLAVYYITFGYRTVLACKIFGKSTRILILVIITKSKKTILLPLSQKMNSIRVVDYQLPNATGVFRETVHCCHIGHCTAVLHFVVSGKDNFDGLCIVSPLLPTRPTGQWATLEVVWREV